MRESMYGGEERSLTSEHGFGSPSSITERDEDNERCGRYSRGIAPSPVDEGADICRSYTLPSHRTGE